MPFQSGFKCARPCRLRAKQKAGSGSQSWSSGSNAEEGPRHSTFLVSLACRFWGICRPERGEVRRETDAEQAADLQHAVANALMVHASGLR